MKMEAEGIISDGYGRQAGAAGSSSEQHQRSKCREEAIALLAQLLPDVESFQVETQRLRDAVAIYQQEQEFQQRENATLWNELKEERDHSFEQSVKISTLEQRCKRAEKQLNKLPDEVLKHLKQERNDRER